MARTIPTPYRVGIQLRKRTNDNGNRNFKKDSKNKRKILKDFLCALGLASLNKMSMEFGWKKTQKKEKKLTWPNAVFSIYFTPSLNVSFSRGNICLAKKRRTELLEEKSKQFYELWKHGNFENFEKTSAIVRMVSKIITSIADKIIERRISVQKETTVELYLDRMKRVNYDKAHKKNLYQG